MKTHGSQPREVFSFTDFLAWVLFALIPVLTAIYAISRQSVVWTIIYIIFLAGGLAVMHRFFCTHCPHYNNTGKSTRCMFFWSLPAFFTPRPGPLKLLDKAASGFAMLIAVIFPLYWLFGHLLLLFVYIISWTALGMFLYKYECIRCIYNECPLNQVDITGGK
jgi:hypothetical protein